MSTARRLLLVPIVALVLCAVAGLHGYLAQRLVLAPELPAPLPSVLCGALAVLFALLVLAPAAERALRPERARWLAWPAAVWMGVAFLLVTLLAASDLVGWLLGAAGGASPGPARVRAFTVAGLALAASGVGLRAGLRPPGVRRVELALDRWPRTRDGYRIVQISDIHIGATRGRAFAADLTRRVNALSPDLVAVTGDLVDGPVAHLGDEVAPFAGLRARDGVFFVTGNHDFYSGARSWCERIAALGMRVLRNQRVRIGEGESGFDLAGVDDHNGRLLGTGEGEDLDRALAGREADRALVLLAHDPSTFKRAAGRGVDLQLSGHTHGGQIWPFRYAVRLVIPFVAGIYRRDGALLYVSRGTGFWGPPMRLGAPAEITEIVLRSGAGHPGRTK